MRMPAWLAAALVFVALPSAPLAQSPEPLPEGWGRGGPAAAAPFSSMQLDREITHGGSASFRIRGAATFPEDYFGAVASQTFLADDYRGRRVRFAGYARVADVPQPGGAFLWMRIDGSATGVPFDNMAGRRLSGSLDWVRHEIVLDVPADAQRIHIGAILPTTGTLWVDDLEFTVVETTVPTTGTIHTAREYPVPRRTLTRAPRNLDFEMLPRP